MSPLLFLVIPIVIFVVGSTVLWAASRFTSGSYSQRKAPADLRTVAPMLRDQRDAGWSVDSSRYSRR